MKLSAGPAEGGLTLRRRLLDTKHRDDQLQALRTSEDALLHPRRVQETLAKTFAGVVRVLVVVAVQYAARGNEDAGDALADHDQRHAAPFAEVHAREGGDVLGLPVNDAACRVAGGQVVKNARARRA